VTKGLSYSGGNDVWALPAEESLSSGVQNILAGLLSSQLILTSLNLLEICNPAEQFIGSGKESQTVAADGLILVHNKN
jgi:hypothetical protein